MCDGRYCRFVYKITRIQMLHESTKNSMSDVIVTTGTMWVTVIGLWVAVLSCFDNSQ